MLKIRHYWEGTNSSERGYLDVPVYPLAGCPWLTVSTANIEAYTFDNISDPYTAIGVWLTRDDYTFTITSNLRPNKGQLNLYQNIVFGCLDIRPINHVHSLYCGGGSGGLTQDIYVHPNIKTGILQHTEGNVYDLSMDNESMSNSNILHTTRFNGAYTSTFRFLSSEGIWKDIFTHQQSASVVKYPTLGLPVDFAYILNAPTYYSGRHNIYPRMTEDDDRLGSKYINSQGYVNVVGKNELGRDSEQYTDQFHRILVNLNPSNKHGEYANSGSVPHCFVTWEMDYPVGEIELGGKKYLSIPCGWEGRLYWYGPAHIGYVNDVWDRLVIVNDWERRTVKRNGNVIKDKLLIELE
jgi:hypothetical protein